MIDLNERFMTDIKKYSTDVYINLKQKSSSLVFFTPTTHKPGSVC